MLDNIIFGIIIILSIGSFVMSYFQLNERGILFNNAYLYGSKEEREKMNKKPYYRQSAVVFLGIGIMFLLIGIEVKTDLGWIFFVVIGVAVLLILFAISSTILINKKNKV